MHRDRITIQHDASTRSNPNPSFSGTLVTNWPATIQSVGGGEVIRGKQIEPHIRWVVSAHWGGEIKEVKQKMRVLVTGGEFAGRTLNIESVLPEEKAGRPHSLQLHCTEIG